MQRGCMGSAPKYLPGSETIICIGNSDFVIVTAHIVWERYDGRVKELRWFAEWVRLKAAAEDLKYHRIRDHRRFDSDN